MTSPTRPAFLEGMSRAAQTVCVVTTEGPAGRGGVTVSTLTSVSADTEAPTLLICVHHTASAAPLILANGRFCVTILSSDQSAIADAFAGRRKDLTDRFTITDWVAMPSGALRPAQALVALDCHVIHHSRVGTHDVLMAEVQDVHLGAIAQPLTYANRAYGHPTPLTP
jgi:flavin reductase (DIM6/NTAB) family NADH-FMN oxidoreductase RutF